LRYVRAWVMAMVCLSSDVYAAAELPLAGVANADRAKVNYMLNCQGCHGQHGSESLDGAVPALQNYVGNFLQVPDGRAFLVQVPGSAYAAISDEALAELLNWILQTQSPAELPNVFRPYTTAEVQTLREHPEDDVVGTRAALVRAIEQAP
jgi:hypothetical protein